MHRHLHLATSASLAAFIGIIGVGGLVLLQQTLGRPLSPNVAVSDRDTSVHVQGRDIVPLGENRSLEADAPPAVTAAAPVPPPDEPAEQTANVTERTALPPQPQTAPAAPEITLRSFARSAEPASETVPSVLQQNDGAERAMPPQPPGTERRRAEKPPVHPKARTPSLKKTAHRAPDKQRKNEALNSVRRFGDTLRDIPVNAYAADGTRRTIHIRPTSIQDVYYYSRPR